MDEELVREFYASLTSSELTEVPVRGIKVPINSNAINEFFEMPDFENDEYSYLMSNIEPEKFQEILEELTVPGSKWSVSKQVSHTCRREYWTPLAKKTGYSQGTITDWDLYRIAGDSVLRQQDEYPEEEDDDPTKNE
ncbi:hypothetical protein J1N35_041587 [Gossypium stocksii]|uniref:Putative plant transposon protein domain-containing protein n=1 Tax=Gossypium stocksii TaxID=47602 RepID=A0A9D3UFS3_9ROSI|nr:hypothetical protein J1N35_041587 [Gossypium stocksii]